MAAHTTTHFNSNRNEMKMNYPAATIRKGYTTTNGRRTTDDGRTDWQTAGRTCQRAHHGPHANCKSQISFCFEKFALSWSNGQHIQRIQIQTNKHIWYCGCRYIYSLQFTAHLNAASCQEIYAEWKRNREKSSVSARNEEIATSLRNIRPRIEVI